MPALEGRVAVGTGGASGLGRATCAARAAAGAHAVAGDVDVAGAEATVAAITQSGGSAEAVALDVTDAAQRVSVVADLFARHGERFDVLVNVAGIDRLGYLYDVVDVAYA